MLFSLKLLKLYQYFFINTVIWEWLESEGKISVFKEENPEQQQNKHRLSSEESCPSARVQREAIAVHKGRATWNMPPFPEITIPAHQANQLKSYKAMDAAVFIIFSLKNGKDFQLLFPWSKLA